MNRHQKRIDANQTPIAHELDSLGLPWSDTHLLGRGFPDAVLGVGGLNVLVEVKLPGARGLNKTEKAWHEQHGGEVVLATTTEEVLDGAVAHCKHLLTELPAILDQLEEAREELMSRRAAP